MENKYQYAAALGRLLLAAIFLWSGLGKLMSYEGTVSYISSVGMRTGCGINWGQVQFCARKFTS
jgi:uncharacterized membrane protein YphA (DoxX/SURF4 family)